VESIAFDQVNLIVSDMAKAVAFYRRLGLNVDDPEPPWDEHHRSAEVGGGLDLDFDSQEFASVWNQGLPPGRKGAVLGFRLADRESVDRLYAELTQAGYPGQQEPVDAFWGARYAIVEDPDGNSVGLMSPSDPSRRRQVTLPGS
jgi:catechol 2,3-dioxygenase-like lactoylglutathione lyase family enzyme